jgi:hypothetical protein
MTRQELDVMWSIATGKSIEENEPFTRYEFAKMVAAKEREDMRKGFAGVTLWLGDAQVTQLVTETQIKYERNQGDALTLAAQKCLEIYAGARGETK